MKALKILFSNNEAWAKEKLAKDPEYFSNRAKEQDPLYLWIGCSGRSI